MVDTVDVATRRERLDAIRKRRQAARGETGVATAASMRAPVAPSQTPVGAGAQPAISQRLRQLATLISRWLATARTDAGETIADTGVSREALAKLMTMLGNAERRPGPGAKIARLLRTFLTRPAAAGEIVVDGVNAAQLRKLIVVTDRLAAGASGGGARSAPLQSMAGPASARRGPGRFWRESGLAAGKEGDEAEAELGAALGAIADDADTTAEPLSETKRGPATEPAAEAPSRPNPGPARSSRRK